MRHRRQSLEVAAPPAAGTQEGPPEAQSSLPQAVVEPAMCCHRSPCEAAAATRPHTTQRGLSQWRCCSCCRCREAEADLEARCPTEEHWSGHLQGTVQAAASSEKLATA